MKPEHKTPYRITIIVLGLLTILILNIIELPEQQEKQNLPDNYVTRVIDGDTFVLATEERVRLICVDTPEIKEKGYEEATIFLESLILNKEVRLEIDISDKDRYNRLLRYVYVNDSGLEGEIFVNKEIVQEGYSDIFRYGVDVKRCGEIEV